MAKRSVLARRQFLRLSVLATAAAAIASCAPTPPAAPSATTLPQGIKAPEPTKAAPVPEAAATRPAAVASAPASPQGTAAPTTAAAPAAKPAAKAAEKPGKSLIGKLEGPEIVTDPARFPKTLKEAPQLAELVKAGKLPPVSERIGQDPLVVKPLHEVGKYGGTWRRGFTGPGDKWNGYRAASGTDHILFWDYTGSHPVPNIAKGWEITDGGKTITIFLRRGMKWSDGQPFTADDFRFWWQDLYNDKDLVPSPTPFMSINAKPGTMEFPDQYTVRWKFAEPYYLFADILAGDTPLGGGHAHKGATAMGSFAPAHYLKQFHPGHVSKEELDKKVKDAKFDNWVNLFKFKNDWALNVDLPTVTPWKTTTPVNTPVWTLERNPYSIWVDTEGNQLPYIDKIVMTLAETTEVVNLRAVAGEYDFQARHLELMKLPVLLENQQKGDYKLYLDPGDNGADMGFYFNLSYEADPELARWMGQADFRRALSIGFDRDQINETFWLGTGTPSSAVPADGNRYFPGPEYRTMWATYDPKKANEMLDKIGLDKKDGEGYRLRADAKGRLRIEVLTRAGYFLPASQIAEMIREQWKKIGIELVISEVERALSERRVETNESQLFCDDNAGSENMFLSPGGVFPADAGSRGGTLYGRWFATGGQKGKEPPAWLREIMARWDKAFPLPEAERIKEGKEIWKTVADQVLLISVMGLGAASMGTRIAKVNMGNVPARQYNSSQSKNPAISRTVTFYWKK